MVTEVIFGKIMFFRLSYPSKIPPFFWHKLVGGDHANYIKFPQQIVLTVLTKKLRSNSFHNNNHSEIILNNRVFLAFLLIHQAFLILFLLL